MSSNPSPDWADYSGTKMFFFAHISFSTFGQTVTLTSANCALRRAVTDVCVWGSPGRTRPSWQEQTGCAVLD